MSVDEPFDVGSWSGWTHGAIDQKFITKLVDLPQPEDLWISIRQLWKILEQSFSQVSKSWAGPISSKEKKKKKKIACNNQFTQISKN